MQCCYNINKGLLNSSSRNTPNHPMLGINIDTIVSPLLSPRLTSQRHSYIDLSQQDSSIVTTFETPMDHPNRVSTTDSSSLLCPKTSHRPAFLSHSCLTHTCEKTSPNLSQKKVAPNLSTESPQGSTSPPMWRDLDP